MTIERKHNFFAGPAVLPLEVVQAVQAELLSFKGMGTGLMESSHRSKQFDATWTHAQALMAELFGIPDTHEIMFLQGGASLQFLNVPLNLLPQGAKADYIDTGTWSKKAIKEAQRIGDTSVLWSGADIGYNRVPTPDEYQVRPDAAYLHYTTNNTIAGTQFHAEPVSGDVPLVADMSSDMLCCPRDVARHAVIYAGAQKNMGPSGVVIVIVDKGILERTKVDIPTYLNYRTHVGTIFNTPNTLGVFVIEKVLEWIESMGGLEAMHAHNKAKAALLYDAMDASPFWKPHATVESRSLMNITWRIADNDLEPKFIAEATAAGMLGLKGHRSVGGLRASTYNACPVASVQALVDFMKEFERVNG
mgnify:CR=1 FL=1